MVLSGYSAADLWMVPKSQPVQLTLTAHGQSLSVGKAPGESIEHLLMKGLVWALCLPQYPDAVCELDLETLELNRPEREAGFGRAAYRRYRPDVAALPPSGGGVPCWWAECGSVSMKKLGVLARELPGTRLTVAKWARSDLSGYASSLRRELSGEPRGKRISPFELISFPADSAERFLSDDGEVSITLDDVDIIQV